MSLRAKATLTLVLGGAFILASCASMQKKIASRDLYRAGFVASNDGHSFVPLLDLMTLADKARPLCRGVNRNMATKAQYTVERTDDSIKLKMTECESSASGNCEHLTACLAARPVAWLARASGRKPGLAGSVTTDWLGRCGGLIAVNFYYGPQNPLPIERVGCAEPAHDAVDTAYDMFLVPRPENEDGALLTHDTQATAPLIENLLRRWDGIVFHATPENQ